MDQHYILYMYALYYSTRNKDKNGFHQKLFIGSGFGLVCVLKSKQSHSSVFVFVAVN